MKWREQHEAFNKLVIQQGIAKLSELNEALPFGCSVPETRINRWLNHILTVPKQFAPQRRYVNRFKLGADPEFIFVAAREGVRVDARTLNLAQGLAFGMDNNGRLTEIRPYPSRSALSVVASILSTLRWLAITNPNTLKYDWQAGAFLHGDGIGGHVHFGRKRPRRDLEVKALDALEEQLLFLRVYPVAEVLRRRQGDGRNHPYGLPGDIRQQRHGYEYRTFPSWLDSPELAFLTITLSKLVVQNPSLMQGLVRLDATARNVQRIWNLLSYYKDVDDDARLALCILARHLPVHIGGDFKRRWGIEAPAVGIVPPKVSFIPSCIKPSKEDIAEMFLHLRTNTPLGNRIPEATWTPLNPIEDYVMVIKDTNTWGAKGLGELLWDVVKYHATNYQFVNNRDMGKQWYFSIPRSMADVLPRNWTELTNNKIYVHSGDERLIYSDEKKRSEPSTFGECRRLLLETVLPFWRVTDVKPNSILQWQSTLTTAPKKKFVDKVLSGNAECMGVKFR